MLKIPANRLCLLLSLIVAPAGAAFAQADDTESLSRFYGFTGLEIFKLERRSANMIDGDFNNDGLLDVVLVDNSHSRIDLLQQKKSGEEASPTRVNEITNDWRFEHRKIPVDKAVAALTTGDFDNDGRTDMAYFGTPDRLIVRYQPEQGDWTRRFSVRLPNVEPAGWMMAGGDLNNDRRDDVVVLGKTATWLLYQNEEGGLEPPVSLMNTSAQLALVQIADLDGDGRNDLCYLAADGGVRGLCARLQEKDGRLGPEMRFDLNRPRAVTLFNLDEDPATEILTIDTRTGRVGVSRVRRSQAEDGELAARLTQYGFGEEGTGKDRDLDLGDIDGDGRDDVVVTDPEQAQMLVFRQEDGRGITQPQVYPGLLGASHVRLADLDQDKRADVVVLSDREKVMAVSRFVDGRLTFPRALPLPEGQEPQCFDLVDLNGDGQPEVVYLVRTREGRTSKTSLAVLTRTDGKWTTMPLGDKPAIELDLDNRPADLRALDANNDGRPDLLIFFDLNKEPALLLTGEDGIPKVVNMTGGIQLGKVGPGGVFVTGSKDTTNLIVAQESFARRLRLEDDQWQVDDQYNAAESAAKVAGSAVLNLDGQPGDEIVLVDTGIKKLRVLRKTDQLYRPWREVELGTFSYRSARVGDLNGDDKDDLLLFGGGRFAVLYAEQSDPTLEEIASFETKLDKVFFSDLVAGDVNADGRPDIAVIDTRSHYIELLNYDPKHGLRHAMHFKVFEEKSFSSDRVRSGSEPREAVIVDVTADGRSDLLLLAHDRVLLYPQDDGQPPAEGSSSGQAAGAGGR